MSKGVRILVINLNFGKINAIYSHDSVSCASVMRHCVVNALLPWQVKTQYLQI